MGHIYREILGIERVIAWRVGDVIEYVYKHSEVPDVLKKFIDQEVITVLGHTNGTATISMLVSGGVPRTLHREEYLIIDDDDLSVMGGYQFRNDWTEIETGANTHDPDLKAPVNHLTDVVNHPAHYTRGKIEVWDFIIDQDLNYCSGNIVKYVCRAGEKSSETHIQDLEKAKAYLEREIRRVKEEK